MSWLARLLKRHKMEDELEKELRFHLEEHAADLVSRGRTPEEARRLARLELGGPEQVKEGCRDARGTRWLEDLLRDVRYAVRTLRRRPGFLAVALITLALGNGATTVMFAVVDGVLLKPMPYPEPETLLRLNERTEQRGDPLFGNLWAFAYPNFLDCKSECRSLVMAAYRFKGGTLNGSEPAEYVNGREISADLFKVLQIPLLRGRYFTAEEDRQGAAPVIIISYGLWQRRYAADPAIVGTSVVFDGKPHVVVGITPPRFRLDDEEVDVFTPIGQEPGAMMQTRRSHPGIGVLARLRPGVRIEEAQSELTAIGKGLAQQYPETNEARDFLAQPLRPDVGELKSTLWLLLGAVTLVLLIACVNVASLLLARALSRERELAMRVALGASRGRLVRQCLTESIVLGLAGGALGAWAAVVGLKPFIAMWPGSLPRAQDIQLDWRVLLFTLSASVFSGLLFGVAPALRAPVRDLEQVLRAGSRTVTGTSRRIQSAFVLSEIALALVLLVAAGMIGRTLVRLSSLDPGVNLQNVLVTRVALSPAALENPQKIRAAWQDILTRISATSGVRAVALVDSVPMREGNNRLGYWTTPAVPPISEQPAALATCVTPDYLTTMGIPLLEGRFFNDHDRLGVEPVVVIDEVMAREAFGSEEPLGKLLWIPQAGDDPLHVVGVVGHVRHWGLAADDQSIVRAQLYYPFAQVPDGLLRGWSELMSVAIHTDGPPMSMLESLGRQLRGVSNDQVFYGARTMEQLAGESLAQHRFLLMLFGIFAGIALLLACIGIYGVLSYLTGQRVPEFAVRIALGATARDVIWQVLRESMQIVALGVAVGGIAAWIAGRLLERVVEGMRPTDVSTFAMMIPLLVGAALLASFLPAWRASRVDAVSALRQD